MSGLKRARDALWATLPHPEYAKLTIHDVLEHEQTHLMPMVSPFDGYVEVLARVSSTCLISVQRNRYSVPCQLAHQMVSAHLYPDRIEVYAENTRIARHVRLMDRDQIRYDWQHYIPLIERKPGALRNGAPFADMPQPLATLQSALLRREHGDRVMAKVLAAVPAQGLGRAGRGGTGAGIRRAQRRACDECAGAPTPGPAPSAGRNLLEAHRRAAGRYAAL